VIYVVPYLIDNYGYIIYSKKSQEYVLVDPADYTRVHEVLNHFDILGKGPKAILATVTKSQFYLFFTA
jgi:glyoxylase-like metal-dependent hydrolase (beta-lactamase superfamily II)